MTTRPCRPWLTYTGNPRKYQPWCECGWRGYGWTILPRLAQADIDRHLMFMIGAPYREAVGSATQ